MTECYFITGTDTAVGKTTASIALLQSACRIGWTAAGYKPVATDSRITPEGLRNNDAVLLQRYSNIAFTYDIINPYVFLEATSPHIISEESKRLILFSVLSNNLNIIKSLSDKVFIEGAGGWFTPLTREKTFADWVVQEKLPVILVVGIRLGCINHALLTATAIQQSGLHFVGWIANNTTTSNINRYFEYLETLNNFLSAPCLGNIPWLDEKKDKYSLIDQYVDLRKIQFK